MKKIVGLITGILIVFSFVIYGSQSSVSTSQTATQKPNATVKATNKKTLVAYYSASGNTKVVAEYIAEAADADLFELVPEKPYTSADLNWTNEKSRVVTEHNNPKNRDVKLTKTTPENWDSYDTIFIGYPIWWGIAAWPVDNFIKENDFTGKTVIPFCTSTSSGIGDSGKLLEEVTKTGKWLEGERFSSSATKETVQKWVSSLNIK